MARFPTLLAALALACAAFAQETEPPAPEAEAGRALDKTRALLKDRPTHAALFDRYFKLLVEANAVDSEIAALQAGLEADASDQGTALIFGRLLLRAGKEERALEVLDAIPDKTPDVHDVLGEIYFKLARFDAAARAFAGAMPAARTSEAKRVLLEKLGRAQLALGQKETAVATWQQIGLLDDGKFHRRLRVAELLAEAGLLAEATAAYAPLLDESRDDPARHCRVLRDFGRLQELEGKLDDALATYESVLAQTARGNWLRREAERRIVQIHRRTGKLDGLVAHLEQQVEGSPDDLAACELLADVLIEMRKPERAAALLERMVTRFPRDAALSRRLSDLFVTGNETGKAIAEYQRILTERPDELELYLELGTLFAKEQQFASAKNQWEKALAQRLADPSLCARLASMYALWERHDDAERLYRRAAELEPDSMIRHIDLAEFLFARGNEAAATAALDAAIARAGDEPRRLETLVAPLREHRLLDRAQACLTKVLAAEPGNQEVRYALADLLLDAGDAERARPLLWEVVDADDKGSGHRTMAANTLVNLAARSETLADLQREAESKTSAGAAFVLGRLHTRARDFARAIAAYRAVLERKPDDVEAGRLLARLLAEEGDFRGALDRYEKIAMLAPNEQRRQFREVARLHMELYDLDSAIEVWRRAMRDNPDNASVFVEVGKEFLEIQRVQEALDAFEQAARLRAHDPDIQLRLADALRQAGKPDLAEKQLLSVATEALDHRDREQARARLFELHAEQGEIDQRIAALGATIAENPYDQTAPQLLGDLYMRTGDFALGLELVERALQFQPRNRELLTRRAELLEALEEWEQARDVHEELLKFPDADRELHLAGIGKALFESGRAQEGKEVFRKIQDRGRISALYKKYELHDEAIDYYQRAIARNPADLRAYVALAGELEKHQRVDEAIATLERVLNLRPYYREALEPLGKLYVQTGRRDDAVKAGMRLFGLRGEEVAKTREEEQEEEEQRKRQSYRYHYYDRSSQSFGQQRLSSAQSYFGERGLTAEWGEILVAEARRRPADLTLFQAVRAHYSWQDKSATKLAAFLRELLARDFAEVAVPPGHTQRSYRQMLEQTLVEVWQQDATVAQARLAELDGGERPVPELLERAKLRQATGKLDEMVEDLRAVLARDPAQPVALTLLAERAIDTKSWTEAIAHLRALAAWWEDGGKAFHDEIRARELESFQTQRKQMLDDLPRQVRRRITDEELLAVLDRVRTAGWSKLVTFSFPEAVPTRFAVLGQLVRLHRAAGDQTGLAAAVADAVASATALGERAGLGVILFQEACKDEALRLLESVLAEAARLRDDPDQVYFWQHYQSTASTAALPYGELLAERGRITDAHRILREHGHAEKAELILRESGAAGDILALHEQEVARARAALESARTGAGSDLGTRELDYRDAVIKLADFHLGEKDFVKAESIYADSLLLLPDDIEIREVLAQLHLRRGAAEEAIAAHEETIAVKRRRKRAMAGDTAVPPTRLQPTVPGASPAASIGPGGSYWAWYGRMRRYDVTSNYDAILDIRAGRNDHQGVLETLRRIMQEDPATFRSMSWQVLQTLRNQDLGKKKLPILRILKGVVQDDSWLTVEYAKACREEGELQEAKRVLEKFIDKQAGSNNDYYAQQATKELEKVDQKLGEQRIGVDELRAAVAADPDNVRKRMRLAERHKKDHDYAACAREAAIVVEKAPYLKKAKELVVDAAAASGQDETAIAMLRRLFGESSSTNDKVQRGVTLANWLFAAGKTDEAAAIIKDLEISSGGTGNYSPGNWFLDKNRPQDALPLYERELAQAQGQDWRAQNLRARVARLELACDKEAAAIRRHLQAIAEAGSLQDREQRWKTLLTVVKGHPDPAALQRELAPAHEARAEVEDLLVLAALQFAVGDVAAAEAELSRAVERSPKEVYLFPLLLGLRRLAGDHDGALAVLDRMSAVYGGSDAMQWQSGVSLTERDRLKIERATILEEAGRRDEATALIESIADETAAASFQVVSTIYGQRNDPAKAYEWYQRYLAKVGTRDKQNLLAEADLLRRLGRDADAFERVRRAYLMARGDQQTRALLIDLHRRAGTLEQFIAELEQEYAKDPRADDLRNALLELYAETDRADARKAIWTSMCKEPDLEEQGLRGLLGQADEELDHDTRLSCLQRLIELKGGEEKKRLLEQAAEVLVDRGDLAAAEARYREALDLETADGWHRLGNWLAQKDREQDSLAAYRKVLDLDPDHEQVLLPLARAAWRNRQFDEALRRVHEYLVEMRGRGELLDLEQQTMILDALDGVGAARRDELLAGGDTADGAALAALLRLALGEFDRAIAAARTALERDGDSILARRVLCAALRRLDRPDDLAAALEDYRVRVEREFVIEGNYDYYNIAQSLQDELGRLAHAQGDDDRAERVWRESPVRRTPYSNPFSYWRSDWSVRYTADHWLGVRRPQRALEALEHEFLLREQAPWDTYVRALELAGQADEVEQFAWKRFVDPLELYGVQSGSYGWIWDGYEYRQANGMQEFLIELYRKQGRLDELRARADELRAQPATRKQADALLESLARLTGDDAFRAEQAERELADRGPMVPPDARFRLAKLFSQAGQPDKALAQMREILDFDSRALRRARPLGGGQGYDGEYFVSGSRRMIMYSSGGSWISTGTGSNQPNPFSFSFGNSYESWWSSSSRTDTKDWRIAAAAFLFATGDSERALEVERDLIERTTRKSRRNLASEIARNYVTYRVPDPAVRVWRWMLEQPELAPERKDRASVLASLAAALRRAGDQDGWRAAIEERRALLEQELADAPGRHAFALRSQLASLLIDELEDAAAGRVQTELLANARPRDIGPQTLLARLLMLEGRAQEAVAAYRELSERRRLEGQEDPPTEQARLGLALCAAGQADEGRALLRQVQPRLGREGALVEAVANALGEPK